MDTVLLLSGRSNTALAGSVSDVLKKSLFDVDLSQFANTEIDVRLGHSVRGQNIFIIQTGSAFDGRSINDHLIELCMMIDACKRSSAKSVTVIVPCYPYSRSDKKDHRGPIGAKLVANLLIASGATRIIATDLHSGQIQAFADIAFDNLYCVKPLLSTLKKTIFSEVPLDSLNDHFVLVSPDAGGLKRIVNYSKILKMNYVTLHKQRNYVAHNTVDSSILIGDPSLIAGKTAIMIDDMIDTCGTMIKGTQELISHGVKNVILMATHGILSDPAIERINACPDIIKVIVTNSIDQTKNIEMCPKLIVVDLGPFLADVIERLIIGASLSELF